MVFHRLTGERRRGAGRPPFARPLGGARDRRRREIREEDLREEDHPEAARDEEVHRTEEDGEAVDDDRPRRQEHPLKHQKEKQHERHH